MYFSVFGATCLFVLFFSVYVLEISAYLSLFVAFSFSCFGSRRYCFIVQHPSPVEMCVGLESHACTRSIFAVQAFWGYKRLCSVLFYLLWEGGYVYGAGARLEAETLWQK